MEKLLYANNYLTVPTYNAFLGSQIVTLIYCCVGEEEYHEHAIHPGAGLPDG